MLHFLPVRLSKETDRQILDRAYDGILSVCQNNDVHERETQSSCCESLDQAALNGKTVPEPLTIVSMTLLAV